MDQLHPVGAVRVRMEIRTYPRDDEAFRAAVLGQLRRFDRVRDLAAIPARLERLLAEPFPHARSRYQDSLASTSGTPVLYVFRDGALVSGLPVQDGDVADRPADGAWRSADVASQGSPVTATSSSPDG